MNLDFLTISLFGNSLSLLAIGAIIIILYQIHHSPLNSISFTDLFLDKKTGKIGGSEFRINIAFIATTWALVFLTIKGNLTEWFIAAYLAAFVVDRAFSRKNIDVKQNTGESTESTK